MPNWCENRITITGPKEELQKLKEFVKSDYGEFSFKKILPPPPSFRQKLRQLSYQSKVCVITNKMDILYYWQMENWGTKWDVDGDAGIVFNEEEQSLYYNILTAWSPPLGIVESLGERFSKVCIEMQYFELGNDFAGIYRMINGIEGVHEEGLVDDFDFSREALEDMQD